MPEIHKVGIYRNTSSSPEALSVVSGILSKKGVYVDRPVGHGSGAPQTLPERLLIVGGEGTNRVRMQEIYDKGEYRPVGLVGGGTQNVLYNALIDMKRFMTLEEFMETPWDNFPTETHFHPGVVERHIFNNQYGLGAYEIKNGSENERLRQTMESESSRKRRIMWARLNAFKSSIARGDARIDMYSVTPNIGGVNAFPDQELDSQDVTHAWIEGNPLAQVFKLAITLKAFKDGRVPPQNILRTERGQKFVADVGRGDKRKAWVDGDTVKNPASGEVVIARANVAIPVVAVIRG